MPFTPKKKKSEYKAGVAQSRASLLDEKFNAKKLVDHPLVQKKSTCTCGGVCPNCVENELSFQPKLTISKPNDPYEQEADRVAEQVMRMPEQKLQKEVMQVEKNEGLVQTKIDHNIEQKVTPLLSCDIQKLRGGGRPLSRSTRFFFEPRIGADFSKVQVHDDTRAARVAQSVNAKAFTFGRDIVFGAGQYSPDTSSGRKLLAHELTHVIQQNHNSNVIHRDLALEPTHPDIVPRVLTNEEYEEAILFNQHRFSNRAVFLIIEDLVGPVRSVGDIDREFIDRVLSIQAEYELTQDGKVGENTTNFFIRELRAEGRGSGAERVHKDLLGLLIRQYRSCAVGALRRAAAKVQRVGFTPVSGSRELTAYAVAFPGRTWASDQPQILAQINAAATRLHGIDIVVVQSNVDLPRITNATDRAFIRRILNRLPSTNTPSFNSIVLFEDWINDRNLRTTRLIHEAFHGLPDLISSGGSTTTIEHGPHPFDNAFAFQFFVSEITGVNINLAFVSGRI